MIFSLHHKTEKFHFIKAPFKQEEFLRSYIPKILLKSIKDKIIKLTKGKSQVYLDQSKCLCAFECV